MAFENADLPNIFCSYSVLSIEAKDEQSQTQILSAALEVSFPPPTTSSHFYFQRTPISYFSYLNLQIAEDEAQDFDSKYRALVAIGSLVSFFNILLLHHFMLCDLIP